MEGTLTKRRRISLLDRETGWALVEHLRRTGLDVSTDIASFRDTIREARRDRSRAGRIRFMKDSDGRIYGCSFRGRIALDLARLDGELAIHEYAHLWCESMRCLNREVWDGIVGMLRNDVPAWEFLSACRPDIRDDDELAEEMIARYSGRRGAERLGEELRRMWRRDTTFSHRWQNVFRNISKALQDFWQHTASYLNIRYASKEEIADRILKDLVDGMNPRRDIMRYLESKDREYVRAVEEGDGEKVLGMFMDALMENIGCGMTPWIAAGSYRELRPLAHRVKGDDREALDKAARIMSPLLPADAVLVPAPSHGGEATGMLGLARAIACMTGLRVCDILRSSPRESQYVHKTATGKPIASADMGIRMVGRLPEGCIPVVIDNVISSGNTAEACVRALGTGLVLCLASADGEYTRVASLRSACPVLYDKNGDVVPLSRRFDMSVRGMREKNIIADKPWKRKTLRN